MVSQPPDDELGAFHGSSDEEQGDHALGPAHEQPEVTDRDDMFAGLSHKQSMAILALMGETTIERAATKVGTSERSLQRWMTQPAFQRAYRLARRQAFSQAIGLVVKYAPLAVSTLVQTMADANAPHHAKVSAATAVLKYGRDGIELDDLAARLEAIEASLNMQTAKGRLAPSANGWSN